MNSIPGILAELYGPDAARSLEPRLQRAIADSRRRAGTGSRGDLDERECVLIAYPDMVRQGDQSPLRTLREFSEEHLAGVVSTIHVLPFFPSSSDEGFSVIDYRSVDPEFGTWEDIRRIGHRFRLMIDAVFNHVSTRSEWFRGFLRDEPECRDMCVVVHGDTDLSQVVRPRALPLLTSFSTPSGQKLVWTTFSADQVDLNYGSPAVLARMVETLLFYVEQGAEIVRLDAVAYIWKEPGTPCIHLRQAHLIVRLFRAVLDAAAPHVSLATETNVPHEENISYFGDGVHEAQLVYNFPLPPLVLHAFATANASVLAAWAGGLTTPSPRATFLNFLASHDGIGVGPARGILLESDIQMLVDSALARGGLVSYKAGAGGTLLPYELNINLWDALADPGGKEALDRSLRRFLAAHAIMLALPGVPAIYFHSLFGSVGWTEGPALTGSKRAVNRRRCDRSVLEQDLREAGSRRALVFAGLKSLLSARSSSACFHPQGGQRIMSSAPQVFALARVSPDGRDRVLCLHNVSGRRCTAGVDIGEAYGFLPRALRDIVSGRVRSVAHAGEIELDPYEVAWLQALTDDARYAAGRGVVA